MIEKTTVELGMVQKVVDFYNANDDDMTPTRYVHKYLKSIRLEQATMTMGIVKL